jgi:hypothetical protein
MKGTSDNWKGSPNGNNLPGSPKNANKQRENLDKFNQIKKSAKFLRVNNTVKNLEKEPVINPFELKRLDLDEDQSVDKSKNSKSKSKSILNESPSVKSILLKTRNKNVSVNANSSSNDSEDESRDKKSHQTKEEKESEKIQGQNIITQNFGNLPTTINEEHLDTYSTLNSNRVFLKNESSLKNFKNVKLGKINSNNNEDFREINENLSSRGESPDNRGLLSRIRSIGDKISTSRKSSGIGVSRKSSHISQSSSMSGASMSRKMSESEMSQSESHSQSQSQSDSKSSKMSKSNTNNSISDSQKKSQENSQISQEKNSTSQNKNDPVFKFLNFVEKKKSLQETSFQLSPIRKNSNLDVIFDMSSEIANSHSLEDKKDLWKRSQEIMNNFFNSPIFSLVFLINIVTALFLENLKIVILPKSWDHSIDVIMLAVFVFFLLEIILHIIFIKNYRFSFFFYADLLAVCGLIPEIHLFYGGHDSEYTGEQETE